MTTDRLIAAAQAQEHIAGELLKREPELSTKKWFDYRYLSATEATQQFTSDYINTYRDWWARTADLDEAPKKQPVKPELFANKRDTITSLWKARQAADQLGTDYPFFLLYAFKQRTDGRSWRNLPLPNQLYEPAVLEYVEARWKEERASALLPRVRDVRFLAHNYRGDPPQDDLHRVLIERLQRRSPLPLPILLGQLIHDAELLPADVARRTFGDDVVEKAEPLGFNPDRPFSGDLSPYVPSCFGIPASTQGSKRICSSCGVQAQCEFTATEVSVSLRERTGSSDPVAERKRAQARERQRRRRARLRGSTV